MAKIKKQKRLTAISVDTLIPGFDCSDEIKKSCKFRIYKAIDYGVCAAVYQALGDIHGDVLLIDYINPL